LNGQSEPSHWLIIIRPSAPGYAMMVASEGLLFNRHFEPGTSASWRRLNNQGAVTETRAEEEVVHASAPQSLTEKAVSDFSPLCARRIWEVSMEITMAWTETAWAYYPREGLHNTSDLRGCEWGAAESFAPRAFAAESATQGRVAGCRERDPLHSGNRVSVARLAEGCVATLDRRAIFVAGAK